MRSGMISKIEKAQRYAAEPERFRVDQMQVRVSGDNGDHVVTMRDGRWACPCDFFVLNEACAHTMALERRFPGVASIAVPA